MKARIRNERVIVKWGKCQSSFLLRITYSLRSFYDLVLCPVMAADEQLKILIKFFQLN